jgi:hypothetical protein
MIWVSGFARSLRITLSVIFRSSPVGASAALVCSVLMAALPSATLVAQRHRVDVAAGNVSHSLNTATLTIETYSGLFIMRPGDYALDLGFCQFSSQSSASRFPRI